MLEHFRGHLIVSERLAADWPPLINGSTAFRVIEESTRSQLGVYVSAQMARWQVGLHLDGIPPDTVVLS